MRLWPPPPALADFLRRPRGAGEVAADVVRASGIASAAVAALLFLPTDAGVVALALPGLLLPRFLGLRPSVDILCCLTLLVAAWSNVLDLYRSVGWWDLAVHVVATGVVAGLVYLLCARFAAFPEPRSAGSRRRTAVITVTALGLAVSALWEMVEWIGVTYVSDEIFVTYVDTIGDMAVGGLGAIVAAVLVSRVRVTRRPDPVTRRPDLEAPASLRRHPVE